MQGGPNVARPFVSPMEKARRIMARIKATPQEAQERAQEKVREALTLLEQGIGSILDGESFARYLRCLSRFHQYSVSNVGLILMQRPEAAKVAGYKAWQTLGRQVRKGEKGIAILVPFVSRVREGEAGETARNPQNPQNPAESAAGGQGEGDTIRVVSRFGVGATCSILSRPTASRCPNRQPRERSPRPRTRARRCGIR